MLDEYIQVDCDPSQTYREMVAHLAKQVNPVRMNDVAWESDPQELRDEINETYNRNSDTELKDLKELSDDDLLDWTQFLSKTELENYQEYLKVLGWDDLPKEERGVRAVALSQNPEKIFMAGTDDTLPTFTKDSTKRLMLTHLNRWVTSREKMAVTGFPVHEELTAFVFET